MLIGFYFAQPRQMEDFITEIEKYSNAGTGFFSVGDLNREQISFSHLDEF